MLCEKCGAHMPDDALTCDHCGTYLGSIQRRRSGMDGMRQGRAPQETVQAADTRQSAAVYDEFGRVPEVQPDDPNRVRRTRAGAKAAPRARRVEEDAGRPNVKKGLPTVGPGNRQVRTQRGKAHHVQRHMVNWVHVGIAGVLALLLMVVGVFFYMNNSLNGQKMLVRSGRTGTSEAYWQVGEEYLDAGSISKAIDCFLSARELDLDMDPQVDNIEGLLLLGSAYEANDMLAEAEALYVDLYTRLVPTRPEAYRNMIRMLLAQNRGPEAGELMLLAYEKTGMTSFKQQRDQYLPKAPETNLTAGRYNEKKTVELSSKQGYDVYYTLEEEAQLPQEGILYTEPIQLDEGSVILRAVAVNGDLVSDPLKAVYTVVMPSPDAPYIRLAPKTYTRRQKVSIMAMGEDKDVTIYYTIDGSDPDADSPIYTGEPVALSTGRVTMKALAVNKYGKASNVREVSWKINVSPYPKTAYEQADVFKSFTLGKTSQSDFEKTFGHGRDETAVVVEGFADAAKQYTYDWGHAVFARGITGGWVVCEVHMTQTLCEGPRKTQIGDSMDSIVAKFRDMNQVASPSGNRGLYEIEDTGKGKIYKLAEKEYNIQYSCYTSDGSSQTLIYHIQNGICDSITVSLTK